jgi:hypothetical protein
MEFVYLKNMPLSLPFKYWPLHVLTNAMLFAAYTLRSQARAFLRAKTQALAMMPTMLAKRGQIQKSRRVSDIEIEDLLVKGWLREKFTQVLRRSPLPFQSPSRPGSS